ncbi:MAG: hypothetical protein FVQ81_14745 [Candidatus Glassbacteria bacterium]|nr:hypothetical protein [Candidatus Glassbacteria bacterium]
MGVRIVRQSASLEDIDGMLEELGDYIKLAVDVERGILAGGGEYHADCEEVLLNDGSEQQNIWGADWYPGSREILFGALINIRPNQGNLGMEITNQNLRNKIKEIVLTLLNTKDI